MTRLRLVLRSLAHHRRAHLLASVGTAVATATIVGALLVGESIRATLQNRAEARLAGFTHALLLNGRTFHTALAARVAASPLVSMEAVASRSDGLRMQGGVTLFGVDRTFPLEALPADDDGVAVNAALAEALALKVGDAVTVRTRRPDAAPEELPLGDPARDRISLRLVVRSIVPGGGPGDFAWTGSSTTPLNLFVRLESLQGALGLGARANALLSSHAIDPSTLRAALRPDDLGLELSDTPHGAELRSLQLFLPPPVVAAADSVPGGLGHLGYLANELAIGPRTVPYAIVAGVTPDGRLPVPDDLGDDEVLLHGALTGLAAKPGDALQMRFFAVTATGGLEERTATFRVRGATDPSFVDRSLLPKIPGIDETTHCRDWTPGIPLDTTRIGPEDEAFWQRFGGTPKAFITLAAGRRLWGNRYGDRTVIRWPGRAAAEVETALMRAIDPAPMGYRVEALKERLRATAEPATDFGGLFLGFGLFLIGAAMLLTVLLFRLGLEAREDERTVLHALGFAPETVRRLHFVEGAVVALAGSIAGPPLGLLFAAFTLRQLEGRWREAVGLGGLVLSPSPGAFAIGAFSGCVVGLCTVWIALRRPATGEKRRSRSRTFFGPALAMALCLAVAIAAPRLEGLAKAGAFFAAGLSALVAWMLLLRVALDRPQGGPPARRWWQLALRNLARHPSRSLAAVGFSAAACFLVFAIAASSPEPPDLTQRRSATGGFGLMVRTTLPFPAAHEAGTNPLEGLPAVDLRVRPGDDASCLSPGQARRPELVGIPRGAFDGRLMFTHGESWSSLESSAEDDVLPAIGDETTVRWMLHLGLGDELVDVDDQGRTYRLRIVGLVADSLLQGRLFVSNERLSQRFPVTSGVRLRLVDVPESEVESRTRTIHEAWEDLGAVAERPADRVRRYHAVERTHLAIFGALGGMGLALGLLGVAVLALRQAHERRRELAVLRALGFSRARLVAMSVLEHASLLVLGLVGGVLSAAVALPPRAGAEGMPLVALALRAGTIFAGGLIATLAAAVAAHRGAPAETLRDE